MHGTKRRFGMLLLLGSVCTGCGSGSSSCATAPTATPRPGLAVAQLPLHLHGIGLADSRIFATRGPWRVRWRYDCKNLDTGGDPNEKDTGQRTKDRGAKTTSFGLVVIGTGATTSRNFPVKRTGGDGHGVLLRRKGGTYIVRVITDCTWQAQITSS